MKIWTFNWKICFTRRIITRKSYCIEKIWIFTIRERTKCTNWHCEETVSKNRRYWWEKQTANKKSTLKNYSKLDLICDSYHSFFKYYRNNKNSDNLSFKSKYSFLAEFLNETDKYSDLKPRNKNTTKKKTRMYDTVSELYNTFLDEYFDECNDL